MSWVQNCYQMMKTMTLSIVFGFFLSSSWPISYMTYQKRKFLMIYISIFQKFTKKEILMAYVSRSHDLPKNENGEQVGVLT